MDGAITLSHHTPIATNLGPKRFTSSNMVNCHRSCSSDAKLSEDQTPQYRQERLPALLRGAIGAHQIN
jgi:hypothetical protein